MRKIRGISLYQPWATFIGIGVKPFETRSWQTPYRGPLAIHAGKNKKDGLPLIDVIPEFKKVLCICEPGDYLAVALCPACNPKLIPLGAFICTCVLTDCIPAHKVKPDAFGDYTTGRWAWKLEDVLMLPAPVPAKGQQGFWDAGTIEDDGTGFVLNPNPAPTYYGAPLL